jgi:hypothetical protein
MSTAKEAYRRNDQEFSSANKFNERPSKCNSRKHPSKCDADHTGRRYDGHILECAEPSCPPENGAQLLHIMEEDMTNSILETKDIAPRRSFFGHLGGAVVLGLAGLAPKRLYAQAQAPAAPANGPDWPGTLQGRHRQVVDAYEANSGFPLVFAHTFLFPNEAAKEPATAVVILRHGAFPFALGHAMWEKYKIGESFKITDPETKAPATKNPFLHPKPGVLAFEDTALDRLLARGVIFGACNVALQAQSKRLASNAGVSAEEAAKEWAANIVPGITVIPSGTWGLNRVQEAGCTYCAGG